MRDDMSRPRILLLELLGIFLVGDGVVTLLAPRRHLRRWQTGPRFFRRTWEAAEHSTAFRMLLVAAKLGIGGWLVACLPVPRPRRWRETSDRALSRLAAEHGARVG